MSCSGSVEIRDVDRLIFGVGNIRSKQGDGLTSNNRIVADLPITERIACLLQYLVRYCLGSPDMIKIGVVEIVRTWRAKSRISRDRIYQVVESVNCVHEFVYYVAPLRSLVGTCRRGPSTVGF